MNRCIPYSKFYFMKCVVHVLLFLIVFLVNTASAQVNNYFFSQSLSTYTAINGTQIDSLNEDDVFHKNIPIGFSFNYNGNVTDRMGICSNGFIVMDSLNHSALWTPTNGSINQINVLMANLKNINPTGSIQYTTLGTAPNRVCVIQWKEYSIAGLALCRLNAQIRLYEGSNCIQLCYGTNLLSGNAGKLFNVGLVGNNFNDYNLRTGNINWLKSNKATSYPGPGMLLNPLVILPTGLVYSYGNCPPAGIPYYYIRGSVFKDVNNNGVRDGGELGMPNITVYDSLQAEYTNTDNNGDYTLPFHDSLQVYRIKVLPPNYYAISSTPVSYSLYPDTQSVINRSFGLYGLPYKYDIRIASTSMNVPAAGKIVTLSASYQNVGTALLTGDTIFLKKDARYSLVNANPTPDYISGDTLAWVYSNLQVDEYRHILVTLLTSNAVNSIDTLRSVWTAKPIVNDTVPANNQFYLNQRTNATASPNRKSVVPDGLTLQGTELVYTIRFQNTVSGFTPENVIVRDTLNSNLDYASFRLLGATHPVTYTISGNGALQFTFTGINLPDSTTNEPASHGAVSYTINPKPGLPENTTIPNRAFIGLDFQPAVQTNTTQNIIVSAWPTSVQTLANETLATVYPNPSTDRVYIHVLQPLGATRFTLYNQTGSLVLDEHHMLNETTSLLLAHLPSGIYYLTIQWQQGKQTVQLIRK